MLKKIAILGLFAVGLALGTAGAASAKAGSPKAAKPDMTIKAQGFCPLGMHC